MTAYRRGQPHFDIDLKWGQEAERKIKKLFRCFVSDDPRVEVKRKRYLDLKFYVETHCDKGGTGEFTESGISTTKSELYVFVVDDTGVYVTFPTAVVKSAISYPGCAVDREERDGACPTRGKLIDFIVLLEWLQKQWQNGVQRPTTLAPIGHPHDLPPFSADDIDWSFR